MIKSFGIIAALLLFVSAALAQSVETMFVTLDGNTGEPIANLEFQVNANNDLGQWSLRTDSTGMASLKFDSLAPASLRVKLTPDSLALARDSFAIDANIPFVQIVLEVKRAQVAAPITKSPLGIADTVVQGQSMTVVADRAPLHERKQVSQRTLERSEMQEVAGTIGDPFRTLSSMPGITTVNDLSVRPYTRGGAEHETRVFWNGAPVLLPYHALSAFSVFNMEAIREMSVYTGGFPAHASNSLSGAILLTSRPAPLDSLDFWTHVSFLKGHMYVSTPVIKDKLGVYLGYQAFWYDFLIKRAMDIAAWQSNDPEFKESVTQYKKFVELPNWKDLEWGLQYRINPRLSMDYSMIFANDFYMQLDPSDALQEFDPDSLGQVLRKVDTLAFVDIPNWIHGLNFRYVASDRWTVQPTLSFQTYSTDVVFNNTVPGRPLYDLERNQLHTRVRNLYQYSDKHLFDFGGMVEHSWDKFDVNLPRVAYELLVRGSYDLLETMGMLDPYGYVVMENDYGDATGDILDNIVMDYDGQTSWTSGGIWFSDRWTVDKDNRLDLGLRVDYQNASQQAFASPRLAWHQRLDAKRELTLATGLYHQDNFEFHWRYHNPELKAEKAWHTNVEYAWDLTPWYRLEWNNYGKLYWDLAEPRLIRTRLFEGSDLLEFLVDMGGVRDSILDQWAAEMGTTRDEVYDVFDSIAEQVLNDMEPADRELFLDVAGERHIEYANSAKGYALGSELSMRYDPTPKWRGWLSGEISQSRRTENHLDFWYDYRHHRPWAIKWHNYFDMPSNWEFSVRYSLQSGLAYTSNDLLERERFDYDGTESDTILVAGRKNSARYGRTTRLDLRWEHNTKRWGHPYMTYFEVWNAFNSQNLLLADSESGKLKWFALSWPMPVIFAGLEFRW